jgi:pimeloyl-ACP methyl ester carboxylesterase
MRRPVNGADLDCVDEGSGTPVVFVHGGSSDLRYWRPQRRVFAATHRFVACSQRGQGESRSQAGVGAQPDALTDDLVGLIQDLDAGPVHLVGFSSAVALRATLRDPARVRSLILIEPNVPWLLEDAETDRALLAAWRADNERLRAEAGGDRRLLAARWFELVNNRGPGTFEQQHPELRRMWLDNFGRSPGAAAAPPIACGDLAGIHTPTLLLEAAWGMAYSRRIVGRLAECIPGADRRVVRAATHFMTYQRPEVLNELLLAFIEAH